MRNRTRVARHRRTRAIPWIAAALTVAGSLIAVSTAGSRAEAKTTTVGESTAMSAAASTTTPLWSTQLDFDDNGTPWSEASFAALKADGLTTAEIDLPWNTIEPTPGHVLVHRARPGAGQRGRGRDQAGADLLVLGLGRKPGRVGDQPRGEQQRRPGHRPGLVGPDGRAGLRHLRDRHRQAHRGRGRVRRQHPELRRARLAAERRQRERGRLGAGRRHRVPQRLPARHLQPASARSTPPTAPRTPPSRRCPRPPPERRWPASTRRSGSGACRPCTGS